MIVWIKQHIFERVSWLVVANSRVVQQSLLSWWVVAVARGMGLSLST